MRLSVDRTWDGTPLPRPAAQLHLHTDAATDLLHLTVEAPFHGDPPPDGPPGPRWGLWEHEVVELFLLGDDERYLEIELGPHGHHLVLVLHGVRRPVERELPLDYSTHFIAPGRWLGEARFPRTLVPPGPLRANAYAIHGVGTARRYAAWAPVPGPAPDFHRLEHFRPVVLP